MKKLILLFLFLSHFVFAQNKDDDYVNAQSIRYQDWVYVPTIKTPLLYEVSWELSPPVIELGSAQQLELHFDDLEGGVKQFGYSFIHCDPSWNPSDLNAAEFMNGFFDGYISNYTFSVNTLQKYTHYKMNFPTTSMSFSKSGNYILKVYDSQDKEKLILTKRFIIYSNLISIVGNVHQSGGSENFYNHQEVDFSILHTTYAIFNPFSDLKVVIQQNGRWDNALYNIKPMFVKEKELTYDYDDGSNAFPGGNEFRNFDMKSIRFLSTRLKSIYKDSLNVNHVDLLSDEVRSFKRYYQNPDINGRNLIKIQEGNDSETEADYCWVNFFFPYENAVTGGNFYVMGSYNDWKLDKPNRMTYNTRRIGYECNIFLKQGYYDYQYVFAEDGKTAADETMIEGTHWDAENDYTIYVYYRQRGTYYDQIIGMKRMNSIRK